MNSEKEIIALKEEQRMALASNAMECLHQNLCDAGCSKEQIKLCMELSDKGDRSRMLFILKEHRKELLDIRNTSFCMPLGIHRIVF